MASTPQKLEQKARLVFGQCVLFRSLPDKTFNDLAARAKIRNCTARETIFLMGTRGSSLMALLAGKVRISVASPEGKEIILATLKPGEIFGEIAVLDGGERTANATAMTDCRLAELDRRDVLHFFDLHPAAWHSLVGLLCERLRRTDRHIGELALLPLPKRLAKTLLRMSEVEQVDGQPVTLVHLSQREIGNVVGASREAINKVLHEWQLRGAIQVDERGIVIVRRDILDRLAHSN
jgi:CRP/FNR family transcriptional regulator, cyclic AMP receptor protein